MFSNEILEITFPRRPLVFSQSCCEVSASLSDVGGLAVGAIDLFFLKNSRSRYLFSSDKLSVVLHTGNTRRVRVLIVVALCDVGL